MRRGKLVSRAVKACITLADDFQSVDFTLNLTVLFDNVFPKLGSSFLSRRCVFSVWSFNPFADFLSCDLVASVELIPFVAES